MENEKNMRQEQAAKKTESPETKENCFNCFVFMNC